MKNNPDAKVRIEGNCDERGTNEYNMALGERRANSGKKYLIKLGIKESQLSTVSYGEEKPFCTENSEECWVKNRRDHFVIAK
jgi:peptidoglycan-associated lipoprotein